MRQRGVLPPFRIFPSVEVKSLRKKRRGKVHPLLLAGLLLGGIFVSYQTFYRPPVRDAGIPYEETNQEERHTPRLSGVSGVEIYHEQPGKVKISEDVDVEEQKKKELTQIIQEHASSIVRTLQRARDPNMLHPERCTHFVSLGYALVCDKINEKLYFLT